MFTAVLPTLISMFLKYWKEVLLISVAAILAVTALTYKGKYEGVLQEHSLLTQQVELINAKNAAERERIEKEQQQALATLEASYRESLLEKQSEINKLESDISSNDAEYDRLLKTLRSANSGATTSTTSTKATAVQHVNVLSGLYEEALRNGREASEEVERIKVEYTQCRVDVDSIYENVNQYNLRVTKYNLRVTEQNRSIENKE